MNSPVLKGISDVARLDSGILSDEVGRLVERDAEVFSLVCAAEAILPDAPRGVTLFLTRPETMFDWQDELAVQAGRYQLTWWSRHLEHGHTHPDTKRAARSLARLRRRLEEASFIVSRRIAVERTGGSFAKASDRLISAHRGEYYKMVEELSVSTGLRAEDEVTPAVQALLDLDDDTFRSVVGEDINGRRRVDAFTHYKVWPRWRDALWELADATLLELGLQKGVSPARNGTQVHKAYVIPDRRLAALKVSPEEKRAVMGKLTFLTYVRAGMVEAEQQKRLRMKRRKELVYEPAVQHLRDEYRPEYLKYRVEEEGASPRKPDPLPVPHPQQFKKLKRELEAAGWEARVMFDGQRSWLSATRRPWSRHGQLVASSVRVPDGRYEWKWSRYAFVACNPDTGTYFFVSMEEFMDAARRLDSRIPDGAGDEVHRGGQGLLIPPRGYRWTNPIPSDVLDLLDFTHGGTQQEEQEEKVAS